MCMTNYERICADKAFCAATIADADGCGNIIGWMKWLDAEQHEVTDELEREKNQPTCNGCKWEFNRSLGSADMCYNCNRMRKKDRYEPKGENA